MLQNLRYADNTTLKAESKEELKSLLMTVKVKEEVKNLAKNSTFRKLRSRHLDLSFMANRWGNNGNSDRLYFGGSKVTADGDCTLEIKRHLLLGRKATTNLDSLLKSRDITLLTKTHLVKAMVFQ